jgi:hypothetical protein
MSRDSLSCFVSVLLMISLGLRSELETYCATLPGTSRLVPGTGTWYLRSRLFSVPFSFSHRRCHWRVLLRLSLANDYF